jgi:6-phosphogluconolactonase (cycloisomerase 2 family)
MADSLVTWKVHSVTATLSSIQHITENLHHPHAAMITSDGSSLFVLNREASVLQFPIDANRGILGKPAQTTSVQTPRSMVLRYL